MLSWANLSLQAWEQMEPVTGISAGDMRQVMSISEFPLLFNLVHPIDDILMVSKVEPSSLGEMCCN